MTATITETRPKRKPPTFIGEGDTPGFKKVMARAKATGRPIIGMAHAGSEGSKTLYFAYLPWRSPLGLRVIGGYSSRANAEAVLEKLGYPEALPETIVPDRKTKADEDE